MYEDTKRIANLIIENIPDGNGMASQDGHS